MEITGIASVEAETEKWLSMLGRECDGEFLRSLDIDFRTAVKFMKEFFAGGGEDEPFAFTTVVLAGDVDAVPDGLRPGPNGRRLRRARKAGMPLAGGVVEVDGGV